MVTVGMATGTVLTGAVMVEVLAPILIGVKATDEGGRVGNDGAEGESECAPG